MKKFIVFVLAALLTGFPVFSQNIPAWNLDDWGPFARTGSDTFYFLAYRQKNFDSMPAYTLRLVNIPMGEIAKPALLFRVRSDYNTWSQEVDIEGIKWTTYAVSNYVVLSFEVFCAAPAGRTIGDGTEGQRNKNKLHFRQFFDPLAASTERLIKAFANQEGSIYAFWLTDDNMNYYYGDPQSAAQIRQSALEQFYDAKAALAAIREKGNFSNASAELIKKYPLRERYSIPQ